MLRGQFTLWTPDKQKIILPNMIVKEGAEAILKMAFRADNTIVASGAHFYVGICGPTVAATDTLAGITTEPSAAGSYARQGFTRDITGVPTIDQASSVWRFQSALLTFTASGGAFDQQLSRLFLCSVASGAGKLFSYSAALPTPITVADGQSYQAVYEMYLD